MDIGLEIPNPSGFPGFVSLTYTGFENDSEKWSYLKLGIVKSLVEVLNWGPAFPECLTHSCCCHWVDVGCHASNVVSSSLPGRRLAGGRRHSCFPRASHRVQRRYERSLVPRRVAWLSDGVHPV